MGQNNKCLYAIGEALIDFMPQQTGLAIKDVNGFEPAVGGAPANVCGAFVKLGGRGGMITQLGTDPFGDKIVEQFNRFGIECDYVFRTDKANTSLAFVALCENGNREFSFYRNPGADMLLDSSMVRREWFVDAYALHFCSVSLGDFPMRKTHQKAIGYARKMGAIISFDPNLRPALWRDEESMISAVREFAGLADIIKISDEELSRISGCSSVEDGVKKLFKGEVKLVIYTEGENGAKAYTQNTTVQIPGIEVDAVDTTGAGDGFIGAFLHCLCEDGVKVDEIAQMDANKLERYLSYANRFCSMSVMKKGAIQSYPTNDEMI